MTSSPDPQQVGPGFLGFLVMFFLALAVVVLVRSMVGHLRKVRYSPDPAALDEQAAPDEQAAHDASGAPPADEPDDRA